ncbi:MAG TPA: Trk system potassium transporter TrkA [Acidobacteriota bacterium]|nr:Trk system potassium transporter TrkA [Acidobacteriota bacterium]
MNIIVIGLGEVGKHIAGVLVSENQNVTLIDRSESALSQSRETLDVMTLSGDGGTITTLLQAKVDTADLVIAVTDNDDVNLLASLMSRKLGAKRVIARVSDTGDPLVTDTRWAADLGIDLVISPERAAAIEIARIIENAGVTWVESFGEDRIEMMRLRVRADDSPAINMALHEIPTPPNSLVAAIGRGESFIIPDGHERLQDGDEIYLIGKPEVMAEARSVLIGPHKPASKVVIVGATPVGRALADQLAATGIDIYVVERNALTAESMAMEIKQGVVVHGDCTQSDFLRSENLTNADVFVAVTKSDEVNLMVGLLAKKLGVPTTIVVAHKPGYATIYEELGIDTTISPRLLAANQILRYVRRGRVLSVSVLANGAGEILEMEAERGAKITRAPLREIGFPKGVRVGAVATGNDVTVPGGDFVITEDARVIIFTTPGMRDAVERLFRKKSFSLS